MKKKSLISCLAILTVMVMIVLFAGSKNRNTTLDYSDMSNWAIYPEESLYDVDVFFIAPTSGYDDSYNMKMDDEKYKAAFIGASNMEKGIYDTKADFYAPFYRQVSLDYYMLSDNEKGDYLETAYIDVEAAFDYYLENINNGRPYIIAGFSQGSQHIERMMEERKDFGDNLVAVYALGWNFPRETLEKNPNMKMAQGEDDTGVIVSFCVESPESTTSLIVPTNTVGINPLNWKTDNTVAYKEENEGACFTNYAGEIVNEIPGLCGGYLDPERGTLKVTDVTPEEYPCALAFLQPGNYHIYCYQFFYRNLQHNVETRIDEWMKNHG